MRTSPTHTSAPQRRSGWSILCSHQMQRPDPSPHPRRCTCACVALVAQGVAALHSSVSYSGGAHTASTCERGGSSRDKYAFGHEEVRGQVRPPAQSVRAEVSKSRARRADMLPTNRRERRISDGRYMGGALRNVTQNGGLGRDTAPVPDSPNPTDSPDQACVVF